MTLDERLAEASERFENPEPQSDQAFDNFCALADDHQNRLQGGEGWL